MISERNFANKHNVYYVEGVVVKTFDGLERGFGEGKLIEKLDKKTGQKRFFDRSKGKWLRKTE